MQSVRCVAVGDADTGKTNLLFTYTKKTYPTGFIPSVYELYSTQVSVDNHTFNMELVDICGSEDYDQLRPLCYNGVNIFIICFSIANLTSYDNVKKKWLPEVKHHHPDVPVLLVGTKIDLRDDQQILEKLKNQNQITITQQQGHMMAKEIKAEKYLECAAITQDGLDEVFDEVVRAFLRHSAITKKTCVVM